MDLSLSGAGFMGCYYFGVIDCWKKYIPRERVNRVAGASAGSLIAAYYLMDLPLSDCLKQVLEMTEAIRRRPLGVFDRNHQMVDMLPRLLDGLFPDDAHKLVSGKLHVCMTRLKDMKKVVVSQFDTRQDLIDALNCSCFIPVWSGNHVSTYKGVKHIDGGFSDNLPVFDEHTIRICCFSGPSDISPYDRAKMELLSGKVFNTPLYFNFTNCRRFRKALFPPPSAYIIDLLERGFHDSKDFILSNDLIQCDSCYRRTDLRDQPFYARPSPSITPRATPLQTPSGSLLNLAELRAPAHRGREGAEEAPQSLSVLLGGAPGSDPRAAQKRANLSSLLREKLHSCSPDSGLSSSASLAGSPTNEFLGRSASPGPAIVVEDVDAPKLEAKGERPSPLDDGAADDDSASSVSGSSDSEGESSGQRSAKGEQRPKALRRTTMLNRNSEQQLVTGDKFTLAPSPLPSCPPSPNLNRHCSECIRMRQEARLDLVEEDIRQEALKYYVGGPPAHGASLGSKLSNPIRWLRQLGMKSSYKFEQAPQTRATKPRR